MKQTTVMAELRSGENLFWTTRRCVKNGVLELDEYTVITPGNMTLWARGSTESGHMNVMLGSKIETLSLSIKVEEV